MKTQWQSSATATYRLPLWWPPEMVLVPTVAKEDRAEVLRRASQGVRSTATAYPTGDVTA